MCPPDPPSSLTWGKAWASGQAHPGAFTNGQPLTAPGPREAMASGAWHDGAWSQEPMHT
jgi:hypothetical protein